ncbi:MAG: hypothetical protein V7733_12830 [Paraglaciecola polaris]|uniref:hypothetical protein n=1 Tax=Paraglaciecola polaris TaxID=222814 RepID=UPI00300175A8
MRSSVISPIILDIEASGFGADSYPIEVGVALNSDSRFCRLIRPANGWLHWSEEAQSLHGISRQMLNEKGAPVHQVCIELNQLLVGKTAYSDGWVVDSPWLSRLFESAGMKMEFELSQLEIILNEQQMNNWHVTKSRILTQTQALRHRASHDAAIILQTYLETRHAKIE